MSEAEEKRVVIESDLMNGLDEASSLDESEYKEVLEWFLEEIEARLLNLE